MHDTGHAKEGIRLEDERIQIFIGNAAVYSAHVQPLLKEPTIVELIAIHHEIPGKSQRGSHALCQIRMFEEGGIVPSRRQNDVKPPSSVH